MREACIELDIAAGKHNLARVKALAPHSHVLAMVKANAYGHGFNYAVQAFDQADAWGVATIEEARTLRTLSDKPIVLIEGVFSTEHWQEAQRLNVSCAIFSDMQLQFALQDIHSDRPIWLKVNTGMNRLGLHPEPAYQAAIQLREASYEVILTTHFACADDPEHPLNDRQITALRALQDRLDPIATSACNSAALLNWPAHHGDWVRPGIMLYGASPFADRTAAELNLKACMYFYSRIVQIDWIAQGETVGYGALFTTSEKRRIATLGVGYGDGYRRVVEHGKVMIHDQYAPIIGRISMDLIAVDVTSINCQTNDLALLWGGSKLSVESVALTANTISYELLCHVTQRPIRILK